MKKTATLLSFLFLSLIGLAQEKVNLVIFSEDLEPFYAYVNGIKQNANPETNVRIANVTPNIALRIEFTNKALPVIKQNMALEPNMEHTARLKYDKNKVMKLRYFGSVALSEAPKDASLPTVNYHTADVPASNDINVQTTNSTPGNASIKVTSSTVTTTQTNGGVKNENAGMNISMPGINMNVTINDPFANSSMQTTTGTTITTSSSSSSSEVRNQGSRNQQTTPAAAEPVYTKSGCTTPMSPSAFATMKSSIEAKPFSDTKMSTARIATKNNCLSVKQVKEIAKLFNMDEDKLAYAKFAYDYCVDKGSYFEVSEVFSFSSTTDEFNSFLDK